MWRHFMQRISWRIVALALRLNPTIAKDLLEIMISELHQERTGRPTKM